MIKYLYVTASIASLFNAGFAFAENQYSYALGLIGGGVAWMVLAALEWMVLAAQEQSDE